MNVTGPEQSAKGELIYTGKEILHKNWKLQKGQGIDFIPSNDFSFYDQVLDFALMVEAARLMRDYVKRASFVINQ